ncbi:hypothetical protein RJI07_09135 [Mycoplasmatota bacterium WC30]
MKKFITILSFLFLLSAITACDLQFAPSQKIKVDDRLDEFYELNSDKRYIHSETRAEITVTRQLFYTTETNSQASKLSIDCDTQDYTMYINQTYSKDDFVNHLYVVENDELKLYEYNYLGSVMEISIIEGDSIEESYENAFGDNQDELFFPGYGYVPGNIAENNYITTVSYTNLLSRDSWFIEDLEIDELLSEVDKENYYFTFSYFITDSRIIYSISVFRDKPDENEDENRLSSNYVKTNTPDIEIGISISTEIKFPDSIEISIPNPNDYAQLASSIKVDCKVFDYNTFNLVKKLSADDAYIKLYLEPGLIDIELSNLSTDNYIASIVNIDDVYITDLGEISITEEGEYFIKIVGPTGYNISTFFLSINYIEKYEAEETTE